MATGYTARREVADNNKCNNCHEQLGTHPNFHGGSGTQAGQAGPRNDVGICNICHNTTGVDSGWSYNVSTYIHGIHGASKRTVPFTWQIANNYSQMLYPGVLKDCNQCHLPNTVNLSAAGGAAIASKLLWTTTATLLHGASSPNDDSPDINVLNNYGNNFSFTAAGAVVPSYTPAGTGALGAGGVLVPTQIAPAGGLTIQAQNTTLVSSPIAAACFSCHDTSTARGHMTTNGGAIYEARSTAFTKSEGCLACHGAVTIADVVVMHRYP